MYPNFRKLLSRKVSFHSILLPGFLVRVFGWMARISEIQQFPEFVETFLGNVCTICRCVQFLESFCWMKSGQYKTSTADCGLRIADCGPQTGYKTRSRYEMRATSYDAIWKRGGILMWIRMRKPFDLGNRFRSF